MNVKADELFYRRLSPRSFKPVEIKEQDLLKLFEAARWAASSFNEQPWRFIYGLKSNREMFERLFSCLSEKNQKWAIEAPVLMLTIAKTYFTKNNSLNRHALHDVGLAMGNLSIQASIMGIMVHQMAGFDRERARNLFGLPKGFDTVAMAAIGYTDEEKKDRKRKAITEIAFTADQMISENISKKLRTS